MIDSLLMWIENNPKAFSGIVALFLGLLGYVTGFFKWMFDGGKAEAPKQAAGDRGVNISGDNSGNINTGSQSTPKK